MYLAYYCLIKKENWACAKKSAEAIRQYRHGPSHETQPPFQQDAG